MSALHDWYEIYSENVDDAREETLRVLSSIKKFDLKVIYFDGWHGFGVSAVFRSIAAVLPSMRTTPNLCFDRIIYIDCSEWKSRRAMQRAIAEELELDSSVLAILDQQDEEDDFNGVDEGSRDVIQSVAAVIDSTLMSSRFMMIFLNGTDDEVDVTIFGIPQFTVFRNNMMMWTFRKRSLAINNHIIERASKLRYTHSGWYSVPRIGLLTNAEFEAILLEEANAIVAHNPCMLDINPKLVAECCLYELFLHYNFHTTTKFSWANHAPNYWMCDGIIQGDMTQEITIACQREINWRCDASVLDDFLKKFMRHLESPFLAVKDDDVYKEGPHRWISVTSGNTKLHDDKTTEGENHTRWLCLYSLWVLDLRYTEWNEILPKEKLNLMTNIRELNIEGVWGWQYSAELQGKLPNLQRLRLIKPTCQWDTSEDVDNAFTDKTSMEILDLSGNSDMKNLPTSLSKARSLEMLILDGCDGLENVGRLPSSLKYFSFDGHGPASQWTQTIELPPKQFWPSTTIDNNDSRISKISLEGCTQLENLYLCGLPNLVELDLSGTMIKVLDFNSMVVQVPRLKRLFLIGCKRLRAIVSLPESGSEVKHDLQLMCMDTRVGTVCPRPSINRTKSFRFKLHVVVMDARLTRSLKDGLSPYLYGFPPVDVYYNIHVTSSPVYDGLVQSEAAGKNKIGPGDQESLQQLLPAGLYSDVLCMVGVGDTPMQAFPQPPTIQLDRHIEIGKGSCYVGSELSRKLGELVGSSAESLHIHDVLIHATVPQYYWFGFLKWCCVERCPKLDVVFPWLSCGFDNLETFWASDLLMARWIWSKASGNIIFPRTDSFRNLQQIHLRSCLGLQFVLPLLVSSFPSLKTLHIIHCGELSHVFVLYEKITTHDVSFPKLTTIHLHDLPKLQQISSNFMMVAPALESIKIRGCWSLRRLPFVGARGQGEKKPAVEMEKDVWDALEWDADHRPDHFEAPLHSRYYKAKLPRVSVLR